MGGGKCARSHVPPLSRLGANVSLEANPAKPSQNLKAELPPYGTKTLLAFCLSLSGFVANLLAASVKKPTGS
jgi:hypothetical protein